MRGQKKKPQQRDRNARKQCYEGGTEETKVAYRETE